MGNITEPTTDKTEVLPASVDREERLPSSDEATCDVTADLPLPSFHGRAFMFDPPPSDFWLAKPVASHIQPPVRADQDSDSLAASSNSSFPLSESELPETFDILDDKEASTHLLNASVHGHDLDNDCPMVRIYTDPDPLSIPKDPPCQRFVSSSQFDPAHSVQRCPSNSTSSSMGQMDALQDALIDFISELSISSDPSKPLAVDQKGLEAQNSKDEEFADTDIISLVEQFSKLEPTISAVLSSPVPLSANATDSIPAQEATKSVPSLPIIPSTSKEHTTTILNLPERPSAPLSFIHEHNIQPSTTPRLTKGLPHIPPAVTYADATNLAMKFPDLASQILSNPLPTPCKPVSIGNISAPQNSQPQVEREGNTAAPGLTASIHCRSNPNWAVASDLNRNDNHENVRPPRRPRKDRQDQDETHASSEVKRAPRRRRGRKSNNIIGPAPTAPQASSSRSRPPHDSYGSQIEPNGNARLDPPPHLGVKPLLHRSNQSQNSEESFCKHVSSRLPGDKESAPAQYLIGHTLSTNGSTAEHIANKAHAPANLASVGQTGLVLPNEWDLLESDPWANELGCSSRQVGNQQDHEVTTARHGDALELPRKRQASPHAEPVAKRLETSIVAEEAPLSSISGRQQRRRRRNRSSRTRGRDREQMEASQDECNRSIRRQQIVGLNVAARRHLGGDDRGSSRRRSSAANSRSDLNNGSGGDISPFGKDLVTSSPSRVVQLRDIVLVNETTEERFHRVGGGLSTDLKVTAIRDQVPVSDDVLTPDLRSGDSPLRDIRLRTNNVDPIPHHSLDISKEVLAGLHSLSISSKSRPVHNHASQENLQNFNTSENSAFSLSQSKERLTFSGHHSVNDWLPPVECAPAAHSSIPLKAYVAPHYPNPDMLPSLDSHPEDISTGSLKDSSLFMFTSSPSGKIIMKVKEKALPDGVLQNFPAAHSRRSLPAQVTMKSLSERYGSKTGIESHELKVVRDIPEKEGGTERSFSAQYPRRHTHSTKAFAEYERKRDLSPGRGASSGLARKAWPVSEIPEWRRRA